MDSKFAERGAVGSRDALAAAGVILAAGVLVSGLPAMTTSWGLAG